MTNRIPFIKIFLYRIISLFHEKKKKKKYIHLSNKNKFFYVLNMHLMISNILNSISLFYFIQGFSKFRKFEKYQKTAFSVFHFQQKFKFKNF